MFRCLVTLMLFCFCTTTHAQLLQRIKGQVTDKESRVPLEGVTVTITSAGQLKGAVTGADGRFVIDSIPVGKHTVIFSYSAYQTQTLNDLLVTSGREVVLDVALQESARKLGEQVVRTRRSSVNEMAIVSTKTFDVAETERYAGSRSDPARMASNFAGVQGADDSRNDIIVRGNSPAGLLWRIEEIDIPNPNHFAIPGTSGGPVSMLNSKTLATSDFLTGAFPAEYGNSISGAFDLKLRTGNRDKYEFTAQLGFLGTELTAEGPLSKKGATFLVAYRYSTLKLFEGLNVRIGTSSIPAYQDATFKLNFPVGKKGALSLFGIGGLSTIDLIVSKLTEPGEELYGESDRDQYFTSNTGFGGASYTHTFNRKTFGKIVTGYSANDIHAHHDKVFRNAGYEIDSLKNILGYRFVTRSWNTHAYVVHKLSPRQTLKAGVMVNAYSLDLVDSSRQYPPSRQDWQYRLDFQGGTSLWQGYVQYKYRPTDQLSITAGLHGQLLSHTGGAVIEPRAGIRWLPGGGHVLSLGYGLHSQLQPLYQYFSYLPQTLPAGVRYNYNMGFTRSHHFVAGYDKTISKTIRLRTEVYYQYLFHIPVELRAGSSFSNINQGSTFSRVFPEALQNTGTGRNYGLELTVEKGFSQGYYLLFTGSAFNSTYKGADGVTRSTDYNGRFALNLLAGYEPKIGVNTTLITGAKITYAGGKLYSVPDVAASNAQGDFVVVDSLRNSLRFPDYFRADIRLGIRINRPGLTHELALDLVNILNNRNILNLTYSADLAAQGAYPFLKTYQLGFLPLFYYRIDFGFRKQKK